MSLLINGLFAQSPRLSVAPEDDTGVMFKK